MSILRQENGDALLLENGSYLLLGDSSVYPTVGVRGYIHYVFITSEGETWDGTETVAFSGTGITVNAVSMVSATKLKVTITIDALAAVTTRTITVTHGASVTTVPLSYTVAMSGADSTFRNGFKFTLLTRGEDFRRMPGVTIRRPLNNQASTATVSIDGSSNPPSNGETFEITDPDDGDRLLFRGLVQSWSQNYEEEVDQLRWDVSIIDWTFLLNKYYPVGRYFQVSVSEIVRDLIARFAPGFGTTYVQNNLAKITIFFDGSQNFASCLNQLAEAIGGGHWYVDFNQVLHFFHIVPTGIILPAQPSSVVHAPLTGAPQTPLVVSDNGAFTSGYASHAHGWYEFAMTNVFDGAIQSALGPITLLPIDSNHSFNFSTVPAGTDVGNHVVTARRIWCRVYTTGQGLTDWLPVCEVGDNTTTSFTLGSFSATVVQGASSSAVTTIASTVVRPALAYVAPPAGAAGGPAAVGSTGGLMQLPPPPMTSLGATTISGGIVAFKVAFLYQDGTESLPSSASNAVSSDGAHYSMLQGLPIGPTINSVPCVARLIYMAWSNPPTRKTLSQIVAELRVSKAAGTLHTAYGAIIGYGDADALQAMNAVPTTYDGLAQVIGYSDLDFLLAGNGSTAVDPDWTPHNVVLSYIVADNTTTNTPYVGWSLGALQPRTNSNTPVDIVSWPNNDGPNPEDSLPQPSDITDATASTLLLMQPAFQSKSDMSQLRNRVYVRGAGTVTTAATAAGGTVLNVADTTLFALGTGMVWANYQKLNYSGVSAPSGPGSILLQDALTFPVDSGTSVNLFYQADDLSSQRAISLIELDKDGKPTDGVHEYTIIDTSLSTPFQLYMRAQAELELFAWPILSVTYATREPQSPGRVVSIDLSDPPCKGEFLIQDVTIDQFHDESDQLLPRYIVQASSVKFELSDLLLKILQKSINDTGSQFGGVVENTSTTNELDVDDFVEKRIFAFQVSSGTTTSNYGAAVTSAGANNGTDADSQTDARYFKLGTGGAGVDFARITTTTDFTQLRYGPIVFFTRTGPPQTLASGKIFAGLTASPTTFTTFSDKMPAAGIMFRVNSATGNYAVCVHDGSTQYDTDTGVAFSSTEHYRLRLDISGYSVKWTIVAVGTGLVTEGTVSIPSTFSNSVALFPCTGVLSSTPVVNLRVSRVFCSSF